MKAWGSRSQFLPRRESAVAERGTIDEREVQGVQYQNDYVLRLIEQMGGLIRHALELLRLGESEQPYELAEQAIGLALEIDPALTGRLSPQSLVSMIELTNLDDRVIELVADSFIVQAEALEASGEIVEAGVRREQGEAVRALLNPNRAN